MMELPIVDKSVAWDQQQLQQQHPQDMSKITGLSTSN